MEFKLDLEVFRFNAKKDYLPHYRKVIIKIDEKSSLKDLLELIQSDDKAFAFPTAGNAAIFINKKALFTKTKMADIVEDFGTELVLEPLSQKRCIHDLVIDDANFINAFDILDAYVDSYDRRLYKNYIREFYASDIVDMDDLYCGDAIFAFAYDMIIKYPEQKINILSAIEKQESGIWSHIDISKRLYPKNNLLEQKVSYLKNEIIKADIHTQAATEKNILFAQAF